MKRWFALFLIATVSCTPIKKAQESYDAGLYKSTISICCTALQSDSTNIEIQDLLARAYFKTGKLDSAEIFATHAFNIGNVSSSKEVLYKIHEIYADSLVDKKEYRKALEEYEIALALYPEEPGTIERIGDTHIALGRYDTAAKEYARALPFVADSTRLNEKLGKIQANGHEADKLIKPARSLIDRKKFKSAKAIIEKALVLKPDHKEAKYNFYIVAGHQLAKNGKLGSLWDAIEQYGLASALKPELAEPHYFMGMSYHRKDKKEYENAFREFDKAIEVEPGSKYAKLAEKKLSDERRRKKLLENFWKKGK
jgi:tetratricopeptide (TPR) repeat protein